MAHKREETIRGTGNHALSHWISEHYTNNLPASDTSSEQADAAYEEEALVAYEQAIELAPREAILYHHKARVLEQLGRVAEAENAYEEARNLRSLIR